MPDLIESEEAARRLGVRLTTLYAYVSRGVIASRPSPEGRRSLFDVDEVERLARRGRGGKRVEFRLATITTTITQLRDYGPFYRGHSACELAARRPFEEVVNLLWQSAPGPWVAAALGAPPPGLATRDLLRWSVVMAGATDPVRHDLRHEAVIAAARRLIATMVDLLTLPRASRGSTPAKPGGGGPDKEKPNLAEKLTARLCGQEPWPAAVHAVNAALVLLADHELATSTLAARLAASTRADIYDVILAALGTLAGPLHGGASTLARALLADADQHGPEWAASESLRWRSRLPGFGHAVYTDRDPRADVLLDLFRRLAGRHERQTVDGLLEIARDREMPAPNVDLGLAAVGYATGMPPDAGETIFTIARTAGWTAHALEELGERPLRFRARAVYSSRRGTMDKG